MTVQTFRELLAKQPFQPFRITMSSGLSYDVTHPELAALTKTDLLIGIGDIDDSIPEAFKYCSLLHITAIDPIARKKKLKPSL